MIDVTDLSRRDFKDAAFLRLQTVLDQMRKRAARITLQPRWAEAQRGVHVTLIQGVSNLSAECLLFVGKRQPLANWGQFRVIVLLIPCEHFPPRCAERLSLQGILQSFGQMTKRRHAAAGQLCLRLSRTVEYVLLDRKLRENFDKLRKNAGRFAEISLDISHAAAHPKLRARP